jgi:UPF0716 family protein affecting phage T7 exclusion
MTHLPEAFFLTVVGLVALLPADNRKYADQTPPAVTVVQARTPAHNADTDTDMDICLNINSLGVDHPVMAGMRATDLKQAEDPVNYWLTPWGLLTLFVVASCFVGIFILKRDGWLGE